MLERWLRRLFLSREDREMEEYFQRQWHATEAEVEAIEETIRKATVRAFTPLDPAAGRRYASYRRTYISPELAEMAAVADAQQAVLAQAFSILDQGFQDHLNCTRTRRGLKPL